MVLARCRKDVGSGAVVICADRRGMCRSARSQLSIYIKNDLRQAWPQLRSYADAAALLEKS